MRRLIRRWAREIGDKRLNDNETWPGVTFWPRCGNAFS